MLDATDAPPPTPPQWLWFGSALLVGLVLMFLIPPFQTNDETLHWVKAYSVSQGDAACNTVPIGIADLISNLRYQQVRDGGKFQLGFYDDGFSTVNRHPQRVTLPNLGACGYPRVAYVVPALLIRAAETLWPQQRGQIMVAYFAARFGNWLTLSVAVLLLLLWVPVARTWTLLVYSIPMMFHQCVSINQDATIMALHAILVIALFRLSGWRQLVVLGTTVGLLVLIKPVYGPLSLLMAPAVWQITRRGDLISRRRRLALLGAGGIAVLAIAMWRLMPFVLLDRNVHLGTPSWTNPGEQVYSIFHHPSLLLAALRKQFMDNLGHGHLTGGFTSVLGVFGWCQYEMELRTYHKIFIAIGLALTADALRPGLVPPPRPGSFGEAVVCRVLPTIAPLLVILLIDVAFWVVFTPPGSPYVIGVQGRYYHGSLFLIGVTISSYLTRQRFFDRIRSNSLHHALVLAALAVMLSVWSDCIAFVTQTYYPPVGW